MQRKLVVSAGAGGDRQSCCWIFTSSTKSGLLLRAVGDNAQRGHRPGQGRGHGENPRPGDRQRAGGPVPAAVVCQEQRSFLQPPWAPARWSSAWRPSSSAPRFSSRLSLREGHHRRHCGQHPLQGVHPGWPSALGLPANLLKLITAVLFLLILVLGNLKKGR